MRSPPPAADGGLREAFEERAARADLLAAESEAAAAPLRFAAAVCRAQAAVVVRLAEDHARAPLTGALERDADRLLELLGPLWGAAAGGPPAVAEEARARATEPREVAKVRLLALWEGGAGDWLSRAGLRPYLELLAHAGLSPDRERRPGACPYCGAAPSVASRRLLPESDGATRFLHCTLCGTEWRANRVSCAACGEDDPQKLPYYQADLHPGARVEACDTCGRYLKSIDLSLDARRVPELDELSSLALDLWAAEQGYERVGPGVLGQ